MKPSMESWTRHSTRRWLGTLGLLLAILGGWSLASIGAGPDEGLGPTDRVSDRHGSGEILAWAAPGDGGWRLVVQRIEGGHRAAAPAVPIDVPGASDLPQHLAIGWLGDGELLVAWTDGPRLWASAIRWPGASAGEPVRLSDRADGRIDIVEVEGGAEVVWSEGDVAWTRRFEASDEAESLAARLGPLEAVDIDLLGSGIFADDFETSDTSAWTATEPPVTLEIVAPVDGGFVNDSTPDLEVIYTSLPGVGIDPSSLLWEHEGSPLAVSCNATGESAVCVPETPFDDEPVTLTAVVADVLGRPSFPRSVSFTVDTAPPVLEIVSPEDGFLTSASEVTFVGTVSEPVELHVGTTDVELDPDLGFSQTLPLTSDGPHLFVWTAEDDAENVTTLERTVIRDTQAPPVVDLSALVVQLVDGLLQLTGAPGAVEAGARVRVMNQETGEVVEVVAMVRVRSPPVSRARTAISCVSR